MSTSLTCLWFSYLLHKDDVTAEKGCLRDRGVSAAAGEKTVRVGEVETSRWVYARRKVCEGLGRVYESTGK